jgi:hypothetical protein
MSRRESSAQADPNGVGAEEKSSVRRRLVSEPVGRSPAELARIVRFARLLRAGMSDSHPDARLLQLAITRRDVTLLEALLNELHTSTA